MYVVYVLVAPPVHFWRCRLSKRKERKKSKQNKTQQNKTKQKPLTTQKSKHADGDSRKKAKPPAVRNELHCTRVVTELA